MTTYTSAAGQLARTAQPSVPMFSLVLAILLSWWDALTRPRGVPASWKPVTAGGTAPSGRVALVVPPWSERSGWDPVQEDWADRIHRSAQRAGTVPAGAVGKPAGAPAPGRHRLK